VDRSPLSTFGIDCQLFGSLYLIQLLCSFKYFFLKSLHNNTPESSDYKSLLLSVLTKKRKKHISARLENCRTYSQYLTSATQNSPVLEIL